MQKHSLIGLADFESVTDFFAIPSFEVAKGQYGALARRKLLDLRLDRRPHLLAIEELLRSFTMPLRRRRQLRAPKTEPPETLRMRSPPRARSASSSSGCQREAARDDQGFRAVHDDSRHPRAQARALLERRKAAMNPDPRVLDHLARELVIARDGARKPEHRRVLALDQCPQRGLVTRENAGYELGCQRPLPNPRARI